MLDIPLFGALLSAASAYDSYFAGPDAMLLPLIELEEDVNGTIPLMRSLPALDPPSFVDPSDPPTLSFDPVANWIRLTNRNRAKLDILINNCLKTICKDYMHECHWYCDPMKGIAERRWLCDECLGPYIRLCGKCFEA